MFGETKYHLFRALNYDYISTAPFRFLYSH